MTGAFCPGGIRFVLIFLLFLFGNSFVKAQSLLAFRVSLNVQNEPVANVLADIERQGNFFFAYNPNNIDDTKSVSLSVQHKKVSDVLKKIFQNRVTFRQVENHIIISEVSKGGVRSTFQISGHIADDADFPLDSVIVYDPENEKLVISKDDGSFAFDFNTALENISLFVSRPDYNDTVIYVGPGQKEINLRLSKGLSPFAMIPKGTDDVALSLKERDFENLSLVQDFVPPEALYISRLNTEKIMPLQFSLWPKVGTNSFVKGLRVNNVSYNLFVGYSKGLKGAEFGGIANIIQKNVLGVQAAGIANVVLGDVHGIQFSGIYSNDFSDVSGFQVSGIQSVLHGTMSGGQISGISNVALKWVNGAQVGGVVNVAKGKFDGAQVAGILNLSKNKVNGAQIAGIANISKKTVRGLQLAGIYNNNLEINGVQLSGLINQTRKANNGVQVSGMLNKTKTLKGLQIGIVNVADTLVSGFQIGLVNIVKHGTYSFELASNETFPFELSFCFGNPRFYSIINLGAGSRMLGIGYGLGYNFRPDQKLSFSTAVVETSLCSDKMILLGQKITGKFALNYKWMKHLSLTGGISGNYFIPDKPEKNISSGNRYINRSVQDGKKRFWCGCFLGIQLVDIF